MYLDRKYSPHQQMLDFTREEYERVAKRFVKCGQRFQAEKKLAAEVMDRMKWILSEVISVITGFERATRPAMI